MPTNKKYFEVKAYLEPVRDAGVIDTLQRIAEKSGLTMSGVVGLLLRNGADGLERALSSAMASGKTLKVQTPKAKPQTKKSRAVKR